MSGPSPDHVVANFAHRQPACAAYREWGDIVQRVRAWGHVGCDGRLDQIGSSMVLDGTGSSSSVQHPFVEDFGAEVELSAAVALGSVSGRQRAVENSPKHGV